MGRSDSKVISPLVLEQPGRWQLFVVTAVLGCAVAPALLLILSTVADSGGAAFTAAYARALTVGLGIAVAAGVAGFLIGLPVGVICGLYRFPGRRTLLLMTAIPLLVPTFVRAIGFAIFQSAGSSGSGGLVPAPLGGVIAFSGLTTPLVLLSAFANSRTLSRSQVDAVRLVRGNRGVFWQAAKAGVPLAVAAAVLGSVLTLADAGPPLLFGYPAPASEILTSVAAFYDFRLAGQQTLMLSALVALVVLPLAGTVTRLVTSTLIAQDVSRVSPMETPVMRITGPLLLIGVLGLTLIMPLAGFTMPLLREFPVSRAWDEIVRSLAPTFIYALESASIAVILAAVLAFAARRQPVLTATLFILILMISLPPALSALGVVYVVTKAPAALDPLLRGTLAVAVLLALRFLPIASIVLMRGLSQLAPSSAQAAAVHGIGLGTYLRAILFPQLVPWILLALILVALLSTAEVSIVLLLRPPDADSLPVALFTIMANAPEALVALLCWLYIAGAGVALLLMAYLGSRARLIGWAR